MASVGAQLSKKLKKKSLDTLFVATDASEKEMKVLKQIEVYFSRENLVTEVPPDTDPEEFETMLKA